MSEQTAREKHLEQGWSEVVVWSMSDEQCERAYDRVLTVFEDSTE